MHRFCFAISLSEFWAVENSSQKLFCQKILVKNLKFGAKTLAF